MNLIRSVYGILPSPTGWRLLERQMYKLDEIINKVIQGDCIEVMRNIPDKSIDLILTDPPYGINFCSPWTNRKERLQNDKLDDWKEMLPKMLAEFKRILTDTGCCCCCCGGGKTPVTALFTIEAIKHFYLIQTLVWRKFLGLGWRYRPAYENIVILSKSKDDYAFYDETKKCGNVIEGINQDIPSYNGDKAGGIDEHPTQKPIELMNHLIKIHSKPNDLIIDPFLGQGTTALSAKQLGRRWIGIEISPHYCAIARKRLDFTEKPLF